MYANYAQADRYRELIGIDPAPFKVLVAVLAYQRLHGFGPTRKQVAETLEETSINAAPLLRAGWLTVSGVGPAPKQPLTATERAWRNLWPWREAWPAPARARESVGA